MKYLIHNFNWLAFLAAMKVYKQGTICTDYCEDDCSGPARIYECVQDCRKIHGSNGRQKNIF